MHLMNIFNAILSVSFMGSIVAGIILGIKFIFKNKLNATWHYYVWLLLIIRLCMPYAPESSFSIFNWFHSTSKQVVSLNDDLGKESQVPLPSFNNKESKDESDPVHDLKIIGEQASSKFSLGNLLKPDYKTLSILWLMGIIILLLYMSFIYFKYLIKVRTQPVCQDKDMLALLENCKRTMNIDKTIPIIYNNTLTTPALFGCIIPKLLISKKLMDDLSYDEKRHVLLHELAHLKRKDMFINWLTIGLQLLHWFNPILWVAFYKMRADCEVSCDAYVLSHLHQREHKEYGATIIKILSIISKPHWLPVTTGMLDNKSNIKRRIKMITMFKKSALTWSILAIILILSVGCVGLTNSKKEDDTEGFTDESKYNYILAGQGISFKDLLEYNNSYVGDNSAVAGILNLLPGGAIRQIALQTAEEPYGIQVDYGIDDQMAMTKEEFNDYWHSHGSNKIFLNNATTLFILISNVDEIQFNVETDTPLTFNVTRKALEDFYGKDLRTYAKDIDLWEQEVIIDTLNSDERIDIFFNTEAEQDGSVDKEDNESINENTKPVTLYFGGDNAEYLIGEVRNIANPTPEKVIQELIKGSNENHIRTMPEDTYLLGVEVKDKVAYVNLGGTIHEDFEHNYGTSTMSLFFLYSIVNTLTLNDDFAIDQVQLLIDGEIETILGPLAIDRPFTAENDFIKE